MSPKMAKNEVKSIEDEKPSAGLDRIQQLEQELQGNTFALKELKQLQYLFEYYDTRHRIKTEQLEQVNKELEKTKKDVDYNYVKLMKLLFKKGNEFGVATHDVKIIQKAQNLSKKYPRKFEFQFLKGLREELKPGLIKKKFVVSDYIPYGVNWLPYSIRRIKERKRNILLLGSSLIQSHRV